MAWEEWSDPAGFPGSAPEISLILHPQGWVWSSTFQEKWMEREFRKKGASTGLDHLDGIAMLWSYDAFHGCGNVKIHTSYLCICLALSSGQNQSCVLQQVSHIDNAAAVYVFFCPHGLQKIYFNFIFFFVRLPMRLAMLSISILPFSECWMSFRVCAQLHAYLLSFNIPHSTVRVKIIIMPILQMSKLRLGGSKHLGQEVIVYQWERWDLHPALFNSFRRPGYQIWVWSKDIKEHINHLAKGPRTWFKEPGSCVNAILSDRKPLKKSFLSKLATK